MSRCSLSHGPGIENDLGMFSARQAQEVVRTGMHFVNKCSAEIRSNGTHKKEKFSR